MRWAGMWVRENTTKGASPTGVFRTPSRRLGGGAYTVCYALVFPRSVFLFLNFIILTYLDIF